VPGGVPAGVTPPGVGRTGGPYDVRPDRETGSVQPVDTANVGPPGAIETEGHAAPLLGPHRRNPLTRTVSVMAGSAGVSVPEPAGDTLTAWLGSFATETAQ